MSTKSTPVTASTVRAWAIDNGFDVKPAGTRGRLPKAAVEAYNKANPRRKYRGNPVPTMTISVKPGKGQRRVTRTVPTAVVREAAVAAGLAKPSRGRISRAAQEAYVLGTLAE